MAGTNLLIPNSGPLAYPPRNLIPYSAPQLIVPQAAQPGSLYVPPSFNPEAYQLAARRPNFQLGPTGPLQHASVPNFQLGEAGPLVTPRGPVGAGPSGIFNVPTGINPALEPTPVAPVRYAIPGETPRVSFRDIRPDHIYDHTPGSSWNSEVPGAANIRVNPLAGAEAGFSPSLATNYASPAWTPVSAEQGIFQGLKSNALLKPTSPELMAEGMAPSSLTAGGWKGAASTGLKGLGKGLGGLAIMQLGNELGGMMPENSNARPGIRAMGNVAGAGMMLPFIGGAATAGAAPLGVGLAEGVSRSAAGNEIINASRNASTNPLANIAVNLNPVLGGEQAIRKLSDLLGGGDGGIDTNNRTNDTVFDVLGGGNSNASQAAAPTITPEQRLAQSSPDALSQLASDYGLSQPMTEKLLKNYHQAMVMAKHNGAVTIKADKDGKIDGIDAKDYPGVKAKTFEDGSQGWVSTNPADIQQAVYEQMSQMVPALGQQQEQEDDYFRKQAVMQAQLEAVLPQYFQGWHNPNTADIAQASIREIPSRYAQAQAQQSQQSWDNQVAQAMQQQQLAQQYPELFGKKQSSQQPATLDAAMAQ